MSDRSTPPTVVAAGGVVWRDGTSGEVEIALVHRPRYDDWSLPKGKIDPGEHPLETARREIAEETGLEVVCGRGLGVQRYEVTAPDGSQQPKIVHYWAMRATGGTFAPNDEVDDLRWVTPADAFDLLTRPADGDVVRRLLAAPFRTSTVLLVRHGSAGDRTSWRSDDMLRPLDDHGRDQARQLARVLAPLYAPTRVVAAEPARCRQTVGPLAAALDLTVEVEAEFGDKVYADDPAVARVRLTELTAADSCVAVCSQGGAIPHLVDALATEAAGGPWPVPEVHRAADGEVRCRKGSVWVLSFAADALVGAEYFRDLTPLS